MSTATGTRLDELLDFTPDIPCEAYGKECSSPAEWFMRYEHPCAHLRLYMCGRHRAEQDALIAHFKPDDHRCYACREPAGKFLGWKAV